MSNARVLDRLAEAFEQIQVFARRYRCQQCIGNPLVAGDVGPGQYVLDPGKIELLDRMADPDRLVDRDEPLAEMVGAQRHLRANLLTHRAADIANQLQSTLADPSAGTAAWRVELAVLRVLVPGIRADHGARNCLEHPRRQVELDEIQPQLAS